MKRREFIALVGAMAALSVGMATRTNAASMPRVGILDPGLPVPFAAFFAGMRELGYVEGENVAFLSRSTAGRAEQAPQLAAELVAAKVDVIVTAGPVPVRAAMQATSTMPIVFAALGDAVGTGAVSNLAHPDRNATGLSFLNNEISAKRLELLHEILPESGRVALLFDRNSTRGNLEASVDTARVLGLEAPVLEVADPGEYAGAFDAALAVRAQAIDILASPYFNANRKQLTELTARYHLPAMYESSEYVRDGGLISYGPSFIDLFRQAAGYVDKIIKGAKSADLPVQQPTKFEMVINLKTAKALGIAVPPNMLALADEVIE